MRGNVNRLKTECVIAKGRLRTESQFIQNLTGVSVLRHSKGHVVSERRLSFAFVLRKLSLSLSEVN
jgi:hypothetical protein